MDIRNEILSHCERRIAKVPIAQLGQDVYVRSLNEREATDIELLSIGDNGKFDRSKVWQTKLASIQYCVCDESGNRVFTEADVTKLSEVDSALIDELYRACDDHQKRRTIEAHIKN